LVKTFSVFTFLNLCYFYMLQGDNRLLKWLIVCIFGNNENVIKLLSIFLEIHHLKPTFHLFRYNHSLQDSLNQSKLNVDFRKWNNDLADPKFLLFQQYLPISVYMILKDVEIDFKLQRYGSTCWWVIKRAQASSGQDHVSSLIFFIYFCICLILGLQNICFDLTQCCS
jgi:hypothetical protein